MNRSPRTASIWGGSIVCFREEQANWFQFRPILLLPQSFSLSVGAVLSKTSSCCNCDVWSFSTASTYSALLCCTLLYSTVLYSTLKSSNGTKWWCNTLLSTDWTEKIVIVRGSWMGGKLNWARKAPPFFKKQLLRLKFVQRDHERRARTACLVQRNDGWGAHIPHCSRFGVNYD